MFRQLLARYRKPATTPQGKGQPTYPLCPAPARTGCVHAKKKAWPTIYITLPRN
ncbi:Uncharacterized protein PPKH_3113 [Pseudomonas putida]|nr:Uncharacterized protein PPKH_3113 [Pseudomonas putida]